MVDVKDQAAISELKKKKNVIRESQSLVMRIKENLKYIYYSNRYLLYKWWRAMKPIHSNCHVLVTTAVESLGSKKPHYLHDFPASLKVPFV